MSFKSLNIHNNQLGIKRESFEPTISIKLEDLESQKHSLSTMHHMSNSSPNDLLKCKKQRVNFTKMSYSSVHTPQPSVARRNERERNRVKMVNQGFATLRNHVPNGAKNKKMSKVETLRSAVEYIRQLQKLLGNESTFSLEQFDSNSMQVPSTSGDENCYPSPMSSHHMAESAAVLEHMAYANQVNYSSMSSAMYSPTCSEMSSKNGSYNLSSPAMAARTSPSPSVGSDITSSSSPYDNQSYLEASSHRQPTTVGHEDELFDLAGWF